VIRHLATSALATAVATGVYAQGPATPKFEVVSVRANKANPPMIMLPTLQPGGRVFAVNLPLRELIRVAYGLRENQVIIDSPLASVSFDLEARAGTAATREQATVMLRTLLAERFGFKAHSETRQLPVYRLERASAERLGPKLRTSGKECGQLEFPTGPGAPPPPPPPPPSMAGTPLGPSEHWADCPSMFFPGGWSLRSMSMPALAVALERIVRRAVVDRTGLSGVFDMDITYTPEAFEVPFPGAAGRGIGGGPGDGSAASSAPAGQQAGTALFTALRDQLGLRLESDRAPVDVLVVDNVQPPTEN
jgi:bla regulator protein blaR1